MAFNEVSWRKSHVRVCVSRGGVYINIHTFAHTSAKHSSYVSYVCI